MVRTMNTALTANTTREKPSFIVELVGPAGAGKTTLLRALSQRNQRILVGTRLRVRRIEHIPFFVRNVVLLLPTLLRQYGQSGSLTRQEIEVMAVVKGWHRVLGQQASNHRTVIVLDQGPVFKLAWLHELGRESLKSHTIERWRDSMLKQWAPVLDMVIWLDAPDTILLERIDARDKAHLVKGESEQDVFEFLARCRAAYEHVISMLMAKSDAPGVLRFDTAQEPLDQIVDKVLAAFGLVECDGS
jgi:shikimate kinase